MSKEHAKSSGCRPFALAALLLGACSAHRALPPAELRATAPDDLFRRSPPLVTPASQLPALSIQTTRLPNGMTIAVVERTEMPIAAIVWASRAAHDDGSSAGEGLAAITATAIGEEAKLDEARLRRTNEGPVLERGRSVSRIGTSFGIKSLAEEWRASVSELERLVRRPAFAASTLTAARLRQDSVVQEEARSPLTKLKRIGRETVWGKGPAALSVDGAGKAFGRFTDEQIRLFHRRTYRPRDSILVAVGPFTLAEVLTDATERFGSWVNPSGASGADVSETAPMVAPDDRIRIAALRVKSPISFVSITSPCTGYAQSDYVAFEVLSNLLEGFTSSSEYRRLRVEHAGSYYQRANCDERRTAGTFTLEMDSNARDVEKKLHDELNELARLRSLEVDSRDIELAKMRYLGRWAARLSTTAGVANALAHYFEADLTVDALATLEARVRAVTPAQVRDVARRYWAPRQLAIAVIGDPDDLDEQLRRVGAVSWTNSLEKRDLPSQYWEEPLDFE